MYCADHVAGQGLSAFWMALSRADMAARGRLAFVFFARVGRVRVISCASRYGVLGALTRVQVTCEDV